MRLVGYRGRDDVSRVTVSARDATVSDSMSDRLILAATVRLDACEVRASTAYAGDTSPYVLTLSSALPDSGIELHSTYMGHVGAQTQAVHLVLAPGRRPETLVCAHSEHELPVWAARQRCLLDHYEVLQRLGSLAGHTIAVDVDDETLRGVDLPARARS